MNGPADLAAALRYYARRLEQYRFRSAADHVEFMLDLQREMLRHAKQAETVAAPKVRAPEHQSFPRRASPIEARGRVVQVVIRRQLRSA
jgi:hypothetical protein